MDISRAEFVLSVDHDSIGSFISHQAYSRTLSSLMRELNSALLSEDANASSRAALALQHLGFPVHHTA